MRYRTLSLYFIGALAAGAQAQTTPAQAPSTQPPSTQPPASSGQAPSAMPRAAAPPMTSGTPATPGTAARSAPRADAEGTSIVDASRLEPGSNSFTEGQAQGRFEDAGFTGIQGLVKDDAGFWRARGTRNGSTVDIAMDFQGRIAAGSGVATLPRQGSSTGARGTTSMQPSGTSMQPTGTSMPPSSTPPTPR